MPRRVHPPPSPIMRSRRLFFALCRKGLLISTIAHPDRVQHCFPHNLGKWFAQHVHQRQLLNNDRAAEYLNAVNGGRSNRTLPTFDGGVPSRISSSDGSFTP